MSMFQFESQSNQVSRGQNAEDYRARDDQDSNLTYEKVFRQWLITTFSVVNTWSLAFRIQFGR